MNFRFDAETHTYYLDDKPISSVTQVLPYEFFDNKPDRTGIGTAIHKVAYLNNIGVSDIEIMTDVDLIQWFDSEENFIGYLEANKKFRKEHPLAGVYDYKRNPYPATGLQLAGYHMLATEGIRMGKPETLRKECFEVAMYHPVYKFAGTMDIINTSLDLTAIYLRDNGTYKLENHFKHLRKNKQVFLSFLLTYNWKKENNLL